MPNIPRLGIDPQEYRRRVEENVKQSEKWLKRPLTEKEKNSIERMVFSIMRREKESKR